MLQLLLLALFGVADGGSVFAPTPNAVKFVGKQLYVDDQPFYVKGLCYSPVPIGETIEYPPFGDYFISDYAYIWRRDLALIKSMGVNTIRIYGWDTVHNVTHYEFLDEVHRYGLKVVLTFYVGRNNDKPPVYINTPELLQVPLTNFTREVAMYGDHPAILMWSFGNELNGPWNGFLKQLAELNKCSYVEYDQFCWNTDTLNSDCLKKVDCLYKGFFGFLNMAAVQGSAVTTRPITSGLADLDRIVDKNAKQVVSKIQLYGHYAPNISAWALQLYKGKSFAAYLNYYANAVKDNFKPLVVTEYGVDAYNDPCGWPENRKLNVCRNLVGDPQGGPDAPTTGAYIGCANAPSGEVLSCSQPGSEIQTKWDIGLTKELYAHRLMPPDATAAPTPVPLCKGPWPGYDQCAPRMEWFAGAWQTVPDVTSDPCSWQRYLYEEQNYCPDPYKSSAGLDIVMGGFLMAWIDERWKGNIPTQGYCRKPCNLTDVASCLARTSDFEPGGAAKCTNGPFNQRAHWECTHDTYTHGLCGYGFESMPDFYMNEEWFGFAIPAQCGHFAPPSQPGENPQQFGLDALTVRPVMKAFQELWNPEEFAKNIPFQPLTCEELYPCWQCLQTNKGTNAYLGTCASACDLSPPHPTPAPTAAQSTGSPSVAPTGAPSTNGTAPTSAAPSAAGPSVAAPSAAPTKPIPAPSKPVSPTPSGRVGLYVKFRLTAYNIQWTSVTGKQLVNELAVLLDVDPSRLVFVKFMPDTAVSTMVEIRITAGAASESTSDEIFQMLLEKQELLKLDGEYGCTSNCTEFRWPDTCRDDCIARHLDAKLAAISSPQVPPADTPTESEGMSPTIIILIVVGVVGVIFLAGLVYVLKSRKAAAEKYSPMTDEGYVPPAINAP